MGSPTVSEQVKRLQKAFPLPSKTGAWMQLKESEEFFETVIDAVSSGYAVADVAKETGITQGTLQRWLNSLEGEMGKAWENARKARAGVFADRLLEIIEKVESEDLSPQQGKMICDRLQWMAERMDPHLWGNKVHAELTVKDERELHLEAVRQLAQQVRNDVIEGRIIEDETWQERKLLK